MFKYTAEAFVAGQHAQQGVNEVCALYDEYCRSIGATGVDRLLDFGDARAMLSPTDEGLHFRIDTRDTLAFYGIWTVVQVALAPLPEFSGKDVEWHTASRLPFLAKAFFLRIWNPNE